MTEQPGDWGRREQTDGPSGFCKKCGRALDDHNGWLKEKDPMCPQPKGAVKK